MIVDENSHFWVLNKPCGEAVNDEVSAQGTVTKGFVARFASAHGGRAFPAHRLDKDTSGLLLVAKTEQANRGLSTLFQRREVNKTYLAVTRAKAGSKPKKKQGWIKGDMEKSRNGSWKLLTSHSNPAETYFRSFSIGERRRLCVLRPFTGKTHQLRVAMKALSMPIVGDRRYGGEEADRLYLHAAKLEFQFHDQAYSYTAMPSIGEYFMGLDASVLAIQSS